MGVTELVLPEEEHEEIKAIVESQILSENDSQKSSAEDTPRTYRQRKADALSTLVRRGHAAAGNFDYSGNDRCTLNVVCTLDELLDRMNGAQILGGAPLSVATLQRISCDASIVRHILNGRSEPLEIGRKSPIWTPSQRRSIRVRDEGHCRFPGCDNTISDIHHIVHWGRGGPTNTSNGGLACPRHHTMVHEGGWNVEGDANYTLTFISPNGERFFSPCPTRK
jgi:hypothetical protein